MSTEESSRGKVWLRFITEKDFSSWAIRWFTWSDWSHVDFALPSGKFLGARLDGGVQIRPHDYIKPSDFCYAYVTVEDPRRIYGWATSQIGKPYDWRAIAGFLPRENWHDPGHWFCSELVAQAFQLKDEPIVDRMASRVSPQTAFESVRMVKVVGRPDWVKKKGWEY